ncbi:GntP family permease [Clostridium sp. KNHs216]|uniref:GntP family permease n=1 Tax=Clostridium sp. KNHs216 TaxID=1550235 RepID=UPI00114EC29B|nr:GntP family permease [Clostridium sp. KNHs216]TQI68033.1 H+/gluconate symporter-like permease [Clostridium sp. KNHs216]
MSPEILSLMGIILGVGVFVVGVFKGYSITFSTLGGAIAVALFSGMDILKALGDIYMGKLGGIMKAYILLFLMSALFGKMMGDTGAAQSIAYKMCRIAKRFPKHEKFIACLSMGLLTSLFIYGGISVFVVIFTLIYIGKDLFEELDIPWFMFTCIGIGTGTFATGMLPGSPQLTNLLPMSYFGTTASAAPVLGILCSIASLAFSCWWVWYAIGRCEKKGIGFEPSGTEIKKGWKTVERVKEQPLWKCLLPSIVMLIALNGFNLDAAVALGIGCLVIMVLFGVTKLDYKDDMKDATVNSCSTALALASAAGFGAVVSASPGFSFILSGLDSIPGPPAFQIIVAINIAAGFSASSSIGLTLTLDALGAHFLTMGIPAPALHRLCSIASLGLDTLPNSSALANTYTLCKLTYKDAYMNHFMLTVVGPVLVSILCAFLIALGITF